MLVVTRAGEEGVAGVGEDGCPSAGGDGVPNAGKEGVPNAEEDGVPTGAMVVEEEEPDVVPSVAADVEDMAGSGSQLARDTM
jgi:hypothetical protein